MYEIRDEGRPRWTAVPGLYTGQVGSQEPTSNVAQAIERTRRARLARWQRGTDGQHDEQQHRRQTHAVRAQDARSASGSHNSDAA